MILHTRRLSRGENIVASPGSILEQIGHIVPECGALLTALARDPSDAGAMASLGALLLHQGYTSAASAVFTQAIAAHPNDAAAHVNLASLLRRSDQPGPAREAYETALRLDPANPEAHQGLAYLLDGTDTHAAARHRQSGFSGRVLTTMPYEGEGKPVTVLRLVSAHGGNIPTAHILNGRVCRTHTVVAEYARRSLKLPPYDVVFNAIGDAEACAPALRAASRLVAGGTARVLNPPARIMATTRINNACRLAKLPGVIAPRIVLCARSSLAKGPPEGFAYPFLLRSPGFHTGQHFVRITHAAELPAALAALPGEELMALQYLDATGPDAAARKYRVMFIGHQLMPLHLAISTNWKVHYFTADMHGDAAYRAEEQQFLTDMPAVLGPSAMQALTAIESTLGLDYGGIDFALSPEGQVLLFEANATMIITPPPRAPIWDYRRPAIAHALSAAQSLIAPPNPNR